MLKHEPGDIFLIEVVDPRGFVTTGLAFLHLAQICLEWFVSFDRSRDLETGQVCHESRFESGHCFFVFGFLKLARWR